MTGWLRRISRNGMTPELQAEYLAKAEKADTFKTYGNDQVNYCLPSSSFMPDARDMQHLLSMSSLLPRTLRSLSHAHPSPLLLTTPALAPFSQSPSV